MMKAGRAEVKTVLEWKFKLTDNLDLLAEFWALTHRKITLYNDNGDSILKQLGLEN